MCVRCLKVFLGVFFLSFGLFASQPEPWALYFQTPATPVMEKLKDFHDYLLVISLFIAFFVFAAMFVIILKFREKKNKIPSKTAHNVRLEILWTLVPIVILVIIGIPSFKIMYLMDHVPKSDLTVKVVGHQWYWSYEYPGTKVGYDSYMVKDADLKPDELRLLAVDKPLVVPVDTVIEVLLTSSDVIHAWAVPAFGIKKDTVPGRLTQTWMKITKEGTYYGQCSELCGAGHGFMPIAVRVVSKQEFAKWIENQKQGVK